MKKVLKLNLLTVCIFLAQQQVYALQQIPEQDLSEVTGQDGIVITHEISKAEAEKINWYDPNPNANTLMGLGLHNFEMQAKDPGQAIKSQLEFDVGATEQGAGIRLAASISPFTASTDLNLIKTNCGSAGCGPTANSIRSPESQVVNSLGKLTLSTSTPLSFVLQTNAGLLNKNEKAWLEFRLQNATLSHTMSGNSLIFNDFNFNFAGLGYIYAEPNEGLVLTTRTGTEDHYINLGRVTDTTDVAQGRNATNPGVNIDLRYHTPNNERKNIMRMGASGAVTNARLAISGDQTNIAKFDISNKAANGTYTRTNQMAGGYSELVGAGGLHLALSADFTHENDQNLPTDMLPTTLEIGHTGKGSYAIEFSKLRPLTTRNSDGTWHGKNAYIDFGNLYFNTITGQELEFIVNDKLKGLLNAGSNTLNQVISNQANGSDFALIAIRGMDFQSIAGKARFISDNSLAELGGEGGSWGIGIPIYNLNANIALNGVTYGSDNRHGLAYNLMLSTEGYGIDAKTGLPSTTSIILIDGGDSAFTTPVSEGGDGVKKDPVNYYAGFRNIDAFLQSKGVIGYEDEGLLITADELKLAVSTELAIGQLPGSKYNCTSGSTLCGTYVPYDNFSKRDDVLTSIAFMIEGSGHLLIIPGVDPTTISPNSNFLSFEGRFKFKELTAAQLDDNTTTGSFFALTNEDVGEDNTVKVSSLNLNKIQGELGLNGKIRLSEDTVVMDNQVSFNAANNIAKPFRTNFAMQTNNTAGVQKIADIAITGGTMRSTLGIKPR